MNTMHHEATRRAIHARASRIAPVTAPLWGRMNAPQMLVHITDSMRMAAGALAVRPKRLFVRLPVIKQLIIYVVPLPKGMPTAPELQARVPAAWDGELRDFANALDAFAAFDDTNGWPIHPAFGHMSRREWGVLTYRHTDHHLRQFGA